jgi:hypothetical protein
LPEFDVAVLTVRSGTHTLRVVAEDASAARSSIQAECTAGQCECPPECCTDDVETSILHIRQVVLDEVTLITADGIGLGALYADDTLRRTGSPRCLSRCSSSSQEQ